MGRNLMVASNVGHRGFGLIWRTGSSPELVSDAGAHAHLFLFERDVSGVPLAGLNFRVKALVRIGGSVAICGHFQPPHAQ